MKQIFEACGEPATLLRMSVLKVVFKMGIEESLANPRREVTQLYDEQGNLLAEHDPIYGRPNWARHEVRKWRAMPDAKYGDLQRLVDLYGIKLKPDKPLPDGEIWFRVPPDFVLPTEIEAIDVIVACTDVGRGEAGDKDFPVKAYYTLAGKLIAVNDTFFPGPRIGEHLVSERYRAMEVPRPENVPKLLPEVRDV